MGSNHRQHDYESCALPLSYAARSRPQRAALALALSLRFFARCLACATRFRLFRTGQPQVTSRDRATGRLRASAGAGWVVAGVGFEPTTFGL